MKYMVVSDIHGNFDVTKWIVEQVILKKYDLLIILGDTYQSRRLFFGQKKGSEMIANILRTISDRLVMVMGNCDSPNDNMYSPVPLLPNLQLNAFERTIYCNHGHNGKPNVEFLLGDIYCSGHTHIHKIENINGVWFINPGSLSLPRSGTSKSYIEINDDGIILFNNNSEIIKQVSFFGNDYKV